MEEVLSKSFRKLIFIFITLLLGSSYTLAGFTNVNCITNQKTLGISTEECQILEKLWESTNGKNWDEHQNWDTLTHANSWEGVTVENAKVVSLLLYSNNLKGEIPTELGDLIALRRLSLSNNSLFGEIPFSLGNLSELVYLELSNNSLNGSIPRSFGLLSLLTELYLNNNQLSENIPDTLGDLENLRVLKIYENNLSGNIPIRLGLLSNLNSLSLSENELTGTIPEALGMLSKLTYLDLKSNKLTGSIPLQLGNLDSLTGLYLQHNKLTGDIPYQLGSLSGLTDLDLSDNKLKGEIPFALGNLSKLTYLNISNNQLSGDLPSELLNLSLLSYLNLSGNQFVPSNIEDIDSELSYIPEYIISYKKSIDKISVTKETQLTPNVIEETNPTIIKVLSEDEIAMLEMATLKIVGTNESGDSLFIKNEGRWSIDDDKIIFTPIEGFEVAPKSIFYTIKNANGVESKPIEVSMKRNKTEAFVINILEKKRRASELYSVEISLPEGFLDKYSESILSDNRKKLVVDTQGVWEVDNNGSILFTPKEGFTEDPTSIEYLVFLNSGDKSAVGIIDIKHKVSNEVNIDKTNTVALFGLNGLLLMILFGGLFGMFYMREIENKKL